MSWTCRRVDREFTPGEAAHITGVTTTLQRDWRRRKIIASKEDAGWTRWELDDLVRLTVMKLFTEAGVDVSKTGTAAAMAIMPTFDAFAHFDEAFEIVGHDVTESQKAEAVSGMRGVKTTHPNYLFGRYLATFGKDEMEVCRVSNLEQLAKFMEERKQSVFSVVDCHQVAAQIVERAGGPIARFEVEPQE